MIAAQVTICMLNSVGVIIPQISFSKEHPILRPKANVLKDTKANTWLRFEGTNAKPLKGTAMVSMLVAGWPP